MTPTCMNKYIMHIYISVTWDLKILNLQLSTLKPWPEPCCRCLVKLDWFYSFKYWNLVVSFHIDEHIQSSSWYNHNSAQQWSLFSPIQIIRLILTFFTIFPSYPMTYNTIFKYRTQHTAFLVTTWKTKVIRFASSGTF